MLGHPALGLEGEASVQEEEYQRDRCRRRKAILPFNQTDEVFGTLSCRRRLVPRLGRSDIQDKANLVVQNTPASPII